MKKNFILPLIICASITTFQVPAYSQQAQGGFFSNLFAPRPAQPANPALGNMMMKWEKETDPIKKKRLAKQIQTQVGVKADGVIGRKTMQAVQQAGGMPLPVSGGNQAGTSVVDFGGSQFKGGTQSQPAQGGFFSNLFAPRPAQPANPALGNKMREWELEPDPNKKRMIAMEIQRDLGVKADGVIGNQTMQAVQKAGGMSGGGMHHGGGMNLGGGGMHHGGGMNPGGGGMHHGGGGDPGPGGGGGPKN